MAVAALGRLAVDDQEISGRLERRLVAALVLHRGGRVGRDALIDLVWGESPPRGAVPSLQSRLSRLRDLAGTDVATWNGTQYLVSFGQHVVDIDRFEGLLDQAARLDDDDAIGLLDEALALWLGPPFAELDDDDAARGEARRLQARRERAQIQLLTAFVRVGRYPDALARSAPLIDEYANWDELRIQRALALAGLGRVSEAVKELRRYRVTVATDTGLEAGPLVAACEDDLVRGHLPPASPVPVPRHSAIAAGLVGERGTAPATGSTWTGRVKVPDRLVGRQREVHELTELVANAAERGGAAALVEGVAGFGKTRLLGVVEAAARAGGIRVGSAVGVDTVTVPFGAIDTVLRQLAIDIPVEAGPAEGPVTGREEARLDYGHQLAASARANAIVDAARAAPLAVLIDDFHWADEASALTVQLLVAAMHRVGDGRSRVAVVVARRTDAASGVLDYVEAIAREPVTAVLRLRPLTVAEVAALIESATGTRPSEDLVQGVTEQVGGSPLGVLGVLRSLHADLALRVRNAQLVVAAGTDLHAHASAGPLHALDRLDPTEQQVLTSLALLRPGVDADEAAQLIGCERRVLMQVLQQADEAGVAGVEHGVIRFRHPTFRAGLRERLTPTAREQAHLDIAARMGQPTTESELLSMAWHSRQSGGRDPRYRRLFLEAADCYFGACDWVEASRYYALAVGPESAATTNIRAGLAAFRSHDHLASITHFDRAVTAAHTAGDLETEARALMAKERARLTAAGDWQADPRALVALADASSTERPDLEAVACGLLSEVFYARGELDTAGHWADRARRAAGRSGDRERQAEVEFAAGLVRLGELSLAAARDELVQAERLAGEGNPWVRSWARCRIAFVELLAGRSSRARAAVTAALELAEPTGAWADICLSLCVSSMLDALTGDTDEAIATAADAELAWRRCHYPFLGPVVHPLVAELCLRRGDTAGALAVLDRWADSGLRGSSIWRLAVLARAGDVTSVRRLLAQRPLRVPAPDELTIGSAPSLAVVVAVAAALGDAMMARQALAPLEALMDRGVTVLPGWPVPVDALLKEAGTLAGDDG